jgi:hypothetical protein
MNVMAFPLVFFCRLIVRALVTKACPYRAARQAPRPRRVLVCAILILLFKGLSEIGPVGQPPLAANAVRDQISVAPRR